MDDSYRSKEKEEPESMNSGDLITQLKEKLKTQAQRIRMLESYKLLCEERIVELCPGHPLPVQPEHIGSGGPAITQELLNSRQKIAKLEQQLTQTAELVPSPSNSMTYNKLYELYNLLHQKYNVLAKEKADVEESLRNEVLASEEQRAYIEVLKQAIEIRIEPLGLKGVKAYEFADYSQAKIMTDESRRETSRFTTKIIDYEAQIRSLTENLKAKSTECKELANERDELTEQLHQAAEALQYAEEEVQKLEEEKMNLIDYVETQTKAEQDLGNEAKELKNKVFNLQNENKNISKSLTATMDENQKIYAEMENMKAEYNRTEKSLKETQQSFINLKARIEEKDRIIQKYKEENNNLSIQNTSLQAENISLVENCTKTEGQLKIHKIDLDSSRVEEDKLKGNLTQLRNYSQQLQEDKYKLEHNYIETDHKLQDLQIELRELNDKFAETMKMLQIANSEKETLKNVQKLSEDQIESMTYLNSETKKQNFALSNELESMVKLQQSTNSELQSLKNEHEQLENKFMSLSAECMALTEKIHELNREIGLEQENYQNLEKENYELKCQLEELNRTVEGANESFRDKDYQFKVVENEIENLTSIIMQAQNDLEKEKYQNTASHEELCRINTENEKLKRELSVAKEVYESACRAAKAISSQLSPLNSPIFKESSFSFSESAASDYNLHRWIESAVKEIQEVSMKYTESIQEVDALKHKITILTQELDQRSAEMASFKGKELSFKGQIENSSKETAYLRESMKTQINGLQQEILSLRSNLQSLYEENEGLLGKNRNLNSELVIAKAKASNMEQSCIAADKRMKLISSEKDHLENLLTNYKSLDKSLNNSYRASN